MSFVKIYGTILDSSIWGEPAPTVKVFMTLLAMADKDGNVYASKPGLTRRAVVSREECEAALETFLAPDPDSQDIQRDPASDGRRIEEIPGGWHLINHGYYRDLRTDKQVADAERIRRLREEGRYDSRGPLRVAGNAEPGESWVKSQFDDSNATRSDVATDADEEADTDSSSSSERPDVRLAQVLNALGCDSSLSWSKLLSGMRQGLGAPGMKPLSWDVLLEAAQELRIEVDRTGGDITPARYKGFVGRVLNRKDREAEGGPHYSDRGLARKPKGYTLQAGEIRQRLLSARIQVQEGPRAGDYILPPKEWKQAFLESEVRAIEAIGAQRIMDADTKQQGIVLAQLARALEEAQT